jgi:transposase
LFFRSSRHCVFAPEGQTINPDFYVVVLRCVRDAARRKQHEMWTAPSWLLHHDNVPAHTGLSIRQLLTKHSIPIVPQPPYSPDLSPKLPLKEEDFRQFKTSSLMWRMTWRRYHKHLSNSASKCRKGSGRGTLLRNGTILKGLIFNEL